MIYSLQTMGKINNTFGKMMVVQLINKTGTFKCFKIWIKLNVLNGARSTLNLLLSNQPIKKTYYIIHIKQ